MINQTSKKILVLCALACACLNASASVSLVSAAEYCDFLNKNAAADPDHLFDEKMGADPETACTARAGTPGNWHYEVIAGRENFPVTYMSFLNEENYCNETGDIISDNDNNADASLRSNLSSFQINSSSTSTLTLATAVSTSTSTSNFTSCMEDASKAAGLIALTAFGHQFMMTYDSLAAVAEQRVRLLADELVQAPTPRLLDFQNSARTQRRAPRLIIGEDGTIQAREDDPTAPNRNRSENIIFRRTLRKALFDEGHPETFVDEVLSSQNRRLINHGAPTSGEELNNILRAHAAQPPIMIEMAVFSRTSVKKGAAEKIALRELTRNALKVVFDHLCLQIGKDTPYANNTIFEASQTYFRYLSNARVDIGCYAAISPKVLAAVDRAEEAWSFSIVAAEQTNERVRAFFSDAVVLMSHAARYYNNALAAERRGDQVVAAIWNRAASQYEFPLIREAIAMRYLTQQMKTSDFLSVNGQIIIAIRGDDHFRKTIEHLHQAAINYANVVNCMRKEVKARAQNNQGAVKLFKKAQPHYQDLADYRSEVANLALRAREVAHKLAGKKLNEVEKIASNFYDAAMALMEASQAHALGNYQEAHLWSQAARVYNNIFKFSEENESWISPSSNYFVSLETLEEVSQKFTQAAQALARGDLNTATNLNRNAEALEKEAYALASARAGEVIN